MKLRVWGLTIAVLSIGVSSLFYAKSQLANASEQQQTPEPMVTIKASYAASQQHQQTRSLVGQIKAVQQATINNELAGKISQLNFKSGDLVERGQLLFAINHSEEDALLTSAYAEAKLNQQTLTRYLLLQEQGRISEDKVDQVRALVTKSLAEIDRIQALINKKRVKAPFSGYVGIHDLTLGQYLDSNTIVTDLIGHNDFVWLDFKVPQTYAPLAIGDSITVINKHAQASNLQATVVSIAPLLNDQSRQLSYRAKLANSVGAFKSNQLVKVSFPISAQESVVVIPQLSVKRDQLGDYVFALKNDGSSYRAELVKVSLGARIADKVVVTAGLKAGRLIASEGAFKLWPGVKTSFDLATINQEPSL